jgi:hypothetical protein
MCNQGFKNKGEEMSISTRAIDWVLRLASAGILFQTLFFKFSGAKESVYIFTALGAEPWGRIGSGIVELIAVVLILWPRTVLYGAILGAGVISGAIMAHLTKLGIRLPAVEDNGELFALAVAVLVCSLGVVWIHRAELPFLGPYLAKHA